MIITSKQNDFIKQIRSLSNKKNRDETGLYISESVKMVKEALAIIPGSIEKIVATEHCANLVNCPSEKLVLVSDLVFESISTEVSPQGIMAIIRKPNLSPIAPTGKCLFLDGVSDPANVGAIIRTAVCAGYKELYLCDTADAFSPKSIRASMGGIYRAKIYQGEREELLRVIDKPIIVADMGGKDVFEFSYDGDFCLAIGNEANGISEELKRNADYIVSIPMENGMESLNASVSAGILMYLLKQK